MSTPPPPDPAIPSPHHPEPQGAPPAQHSPLGQPGQQAPQAQPPQARAGAPLSPAVGTAATSPAGAAAGQLPAVLSGIPKAAWSRAFLLAGLMFAGSLVAALLVVLLALPLLNASSGTSDVALGAQWFPALFQVMGLGYFAQASMKPVGDAISLNSSADASATFFVWVALVPLFAVLAATLIGRRLGAQVKAPTWIPRLILSAAAGLSFALVVTLLAALIPISVGTDYFGITLKAASFPGFLAAALICGATVFLCMKAPSTDPRMRLARATVTTVLEHLAAIVVIVGLIVTIVIAVRSEDAKVLLLFPVLIPLGGLAGFGLMHLVPLQMTSPDSQRQAFISIFSEALPAWVWPVALLLALIGLFVVALRWRARRGLPGNRPTAWLILPGAYAVLGLFLLLACLIRFGGQAEVFGSSVGRSVSITLVAWGFLALAVVGLLIEAVSRFVIVALVPSLPAGLYSILSWRVPATPVAPEGMAEPSTGAQATQGWGTPAGGAPVPGPGNASSSSAQADPYAVAASDSGAASAWPVPEATTENDGRPTAPAAAPAAAPDGATDGVPTPDQGAAWGPGGPAAAPTGETLTSAGAPLAGAALTTSRAPLSPKAKRRWLAGTISVVSIGALVAAGSIAYSVLGSGTFGPKNKVEAYLQALVDGKASEAVKIADPNVTNDLRPLLSDAVYKAAKNRPTDFTITSSKIDGDHATVAARVTQDGKEYPVSFSLTKEGKQAVIFNDWRVESAPETGSVGYAKGNEKVKVNGVEVTLSPAAAIDAPSGTDAGVSEPKSYPLLPGQYVFTAPEASKYLQYGSDVTFTVDASGETTVSSGGEAAESASGSPSVAFQQGYTDAVAKDAAAAFEPYMTTCVQDKVIVVPDCKAASFEAKFHDATNSITRSWAGTPTVRVTAEGASSGYGGTDQADLSTVTGPLVAVVDDGDLTVTHKVRDSYNEDTKWEDIDATDDTINPFQSGYSAIEFPITIDGDKLSVDTSALDVINGENVKPTTTK